MSVDAGSILTAAICAATVGCVIVRPFRVSEAEWAVGGAVLLVGLGLLPLAGALAGIASGIEVYLFLAGMMLLADTARHEGLFDWLAAIAAGHARGSAVRLFTLVYGVGVVVTALLSNDATAVVLTPAVAAVARAARAEAPLPYLLACALVANAASFVLPISNPANLVIYGAAMPPLADWLARLAVPALLAIAATYAALRWTQRADLAKPIAADVAVPRLSAGGRTAAAGIAVTAGLLLAASAFGVRLGWPTALAGAATALAVLARTRQAPWPLLRSMSWSVIPLVAGLFVLVEALVHTGAAAALAGNLRDAAAASPTGTAAAVGAAAAAATNLLNNLPVGLVAHQALGDAAVPHQIADAALIGIDLGPILSVTGSLATILWLTVLRREGLHIGAWAYFKVGAVAMPAALVLALGSRLLLGLL
jgi:arsenical pump membrane protein